jgi:hypothetical protein
MQDVIFRSFALNIGIPRHSVLRTGTSILSPKWPLPCQYFRGFLKSCFIKECIFYLLISFIFTYFDIPGVSTFIQ